ncbi:MAG: J domain-containing protein [Pyrinomonadaceae bacterium]
MNLFDADKDYYATLGAEPGATQGEIERLYKLLAVRLHPDRGGDEEEMKALNEAYGVLRDETRRCAYDEGRASAPVDLSEPQHPAPPYSSPSATVDAVTSQCLAAVLFIFAGLVLLCVVRFQYVLFLWPLALLAVLVIIAGIFQAHAALSAARESFALSHPVRRFRLAQEMAFWVVVCGGIYGVYFVLTY